MPYYCLFCGEQTYCENQEYRCNNEDCDHFEEPVFGQSQQPSTNIYSKSAVDGYQNVSQRVEPDGRIATAIHLIVTPFLTFFNWVAGGTLSYFRFLLLSIKEFSMAFVATGPVALTIAIIFDGGTLTPTHAVVSILICITLAHLVSFGR